MLPQHTANTTSTRKQSASRPSGSTSRELAARTMGQDEWVDVKEKIPLENCHGNGYDLIIRKGSVEEEG